MGKKKQSPAEKEVPGWVMIAGMFIGALTLLFFMGLVVAALFGLAVPQDARFLVVIVFSFGVGLSWAFLGGQAAVKGEIPLPFALKHPIAFSAGGGIAVVVFVLLLGYWLYVVPNAGPPVPAPSLKKVDTLAATEAQLVLDVSFELESLPSGHKLVLQVASDEEFKELWDLPSDEVDDWKKGTATVLVTSPPPGSAWLRLAVVSDNGKVASHSESKSFQIN